MPRPRFQTGHVIALGKGKFRGEWYETVKQDDGITKRIHRSIVLEAESKTEAKRKLAERIAPYQDIRPDASVPLRAFIEKKWLPLKEARWKDSTKNTSTGIIEKQILEPLGDVPLREFDRPQLQTHLNGLAAHGYSHSIVQHTKSFLGEIFDEAEEQGYIVRSPARRLEIPRTQTTRVLTPDNELYTGKPFLTVEHLRKLFSVLEGRDRLIVMLAALCALRPGELFALTWESWRDDRLFIMERIYRHRFDSPKTPASLAQIPVPRVVRAALEAWKAKQNPTTHLGYIFPGRLRGSTLDQYHFSNEVLKPSGRIAVGSSFAVTFQVLRRTFARLLPAYGGDLKAIESVLRHAASKNFTAGTYVQPLMERILEAMDKLADAAALGLPAHAEIPAEPGFLPQTTTTKSVSYCAEVAELADAPA